jgi:hypothetical protein
MSSKTNKSKTVSASTKKVDEQPTVQSQTPVVAVENANKIVENKLQGQVVEVKKGGSRAKSAPVVQVAQPVVVPETQTAGAKGKKTTKTEQVAQQVEAVAQVAQPVVVPETQTAGAKGKKSGKTVQAVVEPVAQVAQPVVVPETQTAGAKGKKSAKTAQVEVAAQVAETQVAETQVAGAKGKKATKAKVQQVEQVQAVQAVQEDEEEQVGGKLRYFKLFYNNQNKGRYCGKKPKQAANKAFSSIIKELNANGKNEGVNVDIHFSIMECTRNSKRKEYRYMGKREVLPEPVPVYIPHNEELAKDSLKSETSVKNIPIKQKKVETMHSGKEVTTTGGSIYLVSNSGQTFKKIIYHYHNKIQKAPKVVAEVAQ